MAIYLAQKNSPSRTLITRENSELLKDWYKIVIFKIQDEVEALLFHAKDYYWDIINRECKWEKILDTNWEKIRAWVIEDRHFVCSWVVNITDPNKKTINSSPITSIADKRYHDPELTREEIDNLKNIVTKMIEDIL